MHLSNTDVLSSEISTLPTYAFVLVNKESLASHRPIPRTEPLPSVTAPKARPTLDTSISTPGTIPH
jgi:hypothetical protein